MAISGIDGIDGITLAHTSRNSNVTVEFSVARRDGWSKVDAIFAWVALNLGPQFVYVSQLLYCYITQCLNWH